MPLFARFVRGFVGFLLLSIYHFIVVWRSPALRLLCAAVSALCPVVFDGVLHFCADRFFFVLFSDVCVVFNVFFVRGFDFYLVVFRIAC